MLINALKLRDAFVNSIDCSYQGQLALNAFDAAVKEVRTKKQAKVMKNLLEVAGEKIAIEDEDFCAMDTGNYDDAWRGGMQDGERALAWEILTAFEVPFEMEEDWQESEDGED